MIKKIKENSVLIIIAATVGAILSHQLSNPDIINLIRNINRFGSIINITPSINYILHWLGYFIIVGIFATVIFLVVFSLLCIFYKIGDLFYLFSKKIRRLLIPKKKYRTKP
ncbi:hypothetical protein J4209_06185 [Candidatus Woesearchaeota archaeon]|nr:hypothetical protein [Candidatus Woesearchaeota archaeon]